MILPANRDCCQEHLLIHQLILLVRIYAGSALCLSKALACSLLIWCGYTQLDLFWYPFSPFIRNPVTSCSSTHPVYFFAVTTLFFVSCRNGKRYFHLAIYRNIFLPCSNGKRYFHLAVAFSCSGNGVCCLGISVMFPGMVNAKIY